jgi:hypothetical protein
MKNQETQHSQDIAHCPKCNANAVEKCGQPQASDCPREANKS